MLRRFLSLIFLFCLLTAWAPAAPVTAPEADSPSITAEPAAPTTIEPVVPTPSEPTLPDGQRWMTHFNDDLLPFNKGRKKAPFSLTSCAAT